MAFDLDNDELKATREKSADEIFKDLGYEIEYFENGVGYYIGDEENIIEILKNLENNKPEIWINDDFHAITMEELKAIYKKCDEMRYI